MGYNNKTLVVEDEEDIRKILSLYLQVNNLEYDLAEDGEVALKKINEEARRGFSYRTVLTDLDMPKLDGVRLIELIGERVGRGEILRPNIYVLTGGFHRQDEVYESDSVRKVFEKKDFRKAIEEIKRVYK